MTVQKSRSEAYTYLSSLKNAGFLTESEINPKGDLLIIAKIRKAGASIRYVIVHTNNGWLKLTKYVNGIKASGT